MKVGIVCPYSFDVPGGVQFHVRDLAEHLISLGHEVSVLAPADTEDGDLPAYLVSCGRAVPVRYNGSVARLTFGPITQARVGRWLEAGQFDVLHIHEPMTPSVSVMALWAATDEPIVATFHTATVKSRAMHAAHPILRPSMEKIRGRIAVSEEARATVRRHLKGDAVVIPNGVDVGHFELAPRDDRFTGTPAGPTLAFLGRIDEPRKGLAVLLAAMPHVLSRFPGARLLVAGPGDAEDALKDVSAEVAAATTMLGMVSEEDKASLLRSCDLYVAPHLGGESFGIVLVEAMAAGAPVLASDLEAFTQVLDGGACGVQVPVGDADALGAAAVDLLADPDRRRLLSAAGHGRARVFDWGVVAAHILAVYETVIAGSEAEPDAPLSTSLWGRLIGSGRDEAPGTGPDEMTVAGAAPLDPLSEAP